MEERRVAMNGVSLVDGSNDGLARLSSGSLPGLSHASSRPSSPSASMDSSMDNTSEDDDSTRRGEAGGRHAVAAVSKCPFSIEKLLEAPKVPRGRRPNSKYPRVQACKSLGPLALNMLPLFQITQPVGFVVEQIEPRSPAAEVSGAQDENPRVCSHQDTVLDHPATGVKAEPDERETSQSTPESARKDSQSKLRAEFWKNIQRAAEERARSSQTERVTDTKDIATKERSGTAGEEDIDVVSEESGLGLGDSLVQSSSAMDTSEDVEDDTQVEGQSTERKLDSASRQSE